MKKPARTTIAYGGPDPMATEAGRKEVEAAAAKHERQMQAEHDKNLKPGERRLRFRVSAGQYLRGDFGVSFWDEQN